MPVRLNVGVDGIGKAALLAHFFHQFRGKTSAAEDVIDDECRHEVRILARHGAKAENCNRLRNAHVYDALTAAGDRLRFRDGEQIGLFGQAAEHVIDEFSKFGRCDVSDGDDLQVVTGKDALVICSRSSRVIFETVSTVPLEGSA